jgi:hypothetical protein
VLFRYAAIASSVVVGKPKVMLAATMRALLVGSVIGRLNAGGVP